MPKVGRESKIKKGIYIFVFFTIYFICVMPLTAVHAATIQAKSCSYGDVSSAVSLAARGDTVVVPSGSCRWSGSLNITKAITLQGAGIDTTTITGNINSTNAYIISFVPSSPSADTEVLFRITGFTFKAIDTSNVRTTNGGTTYYWRNGGIKLASTANPPVPLRKVRIDNNKFYDFVSKSTTQESLCISVVGSFFGVIDNNIFDGDTIIIFSHSKPWYRWNNTKFSYASDDTFYIEDNIFVKRPIFYYYENIVQANQSGSYVFRYNTVSFPSLQEGWNWLYGFDIHHQGSGLLAPFGAEVYGNKWTVPDGKVFTLGQYRSGMGMLFYNKVVFPKTVSESRFELWEQYRDDIDATKNPSWLLNTTCPSGTLYAGTKTCGVDQRPQHVHNTYIWNNRKGLATGSSQTLLSMRVCVNYPCDSTGDAFPLRENTDWWKDNSGCSGESCAEGVGCGTTLPSSCVTGTAYWKTSQSCSQVPSASIGKNPSAPLDGTLYKCVSRNTWKAYYSPYTYPHPLQGGEVETISAPKGFKLVN